MLTRRTSAILLTGALLGTGGCQGEPEPAPVKPSRSEQTVSQQPVPERTASRIGEEAVKAFEADIQDGGAQVNVLQGVCAIIGIKTNPTSEMTIYTVPKPAILGAPVPGTESGVLVTVGYDAVHEQFVHGPVTVVSENSSGTRTQTIKSLHDELDILFDGADPTNVSAELSVKSGQVVDSRERSFVMDVSSTGTGKSVKEFADSQIAELACASTVDPIYEDDTFGSDPTNA